MPLSKEANRIRMMVARDNEKYYYQAIEKQRTGLTKLAYADWLKMYNWDYMFTVTFRKPRREPYYAANSIWSVLNCDLGHDYISYNPGRAFIGVEPHSSGDLHCHGLLADKGVENGQPWLPEIALPWDIWEGFFKAFGRSKVEVCNSREAAAGYCSKYILKKQSSVADHYYIFGDKRFWRAGIDNMCYNELSGHGQLKGD